MIEATLSPNERLRLAKLHSLGVLDTPYERNFDEITSLAAELCEAPIALVTLVDDTRQWFKSKVGLEANETPRSMAFCAHAILQDNIFEVTDTLKDERFHDNPLVTQDPNIRFYAGAPLTTTDGYNLGTLCVISDAPKALNEKQRYVLELLARNVVKEIELRSELEQRAIIERELKLAKDIAQAASRAKSNFVSIISHELRTPINAIIGFSHLLRADQDPHNQAEYIDSISFSSENLLRIVNEVLDFSKIEEGKLSLEPTPTALQPLLIAIVQTHRLKAKEKGIDLQLDYDHAIPTVLKLDALRLGQVIQNLLSNALKFTNKGHVTLTVRLQEKTKNQATINFAVSDTGIGIAEAHQDKVFESFTQAETYTTSKYGGTGLGLSISKTLVELMGGQIMLNTKIGAGSTFSFTLTFDSQDEVTSPTPPSNMNSVPTGDFAKPNILLAEDNEMNVMVISRFLNRWNIYPDVAQDGQEAVSMAAAKQYDLILMDLMMPIMSGAQAVETIRNQDGPNAHTPILALSATSEAEVSQLVQTSGFTNYVNKPFTPQDLFDKLSTYLPSRPEAPNA